MNPLDRFREKVVVAFEVPTIIANRVRDCAALGSRSEESLWILWAATGATFRTKYRSLEEKVFHFARRKDLSIADATALLITKGLTELEKSETSAAEQVSPREEESRFD